MHPVDFYMMWYRIPGHKSSICWGWIQLTQTYLPSLQQSYGFVRSQLYGRDFLSPEEHFAV